MSEQDLKMQQLAEALAPQFRVVNHEEFLEIIDSDGCIVALALVEPPVVEVELSCVFTQMVEDDDALQEIAEEADGIMREVIAGAWAAQGFEGNDIGEIRESELVEDETQFILSYDLGVVKKCESVAELAEAIRWSAAQECDFII